MGWEWVLGIGMCFKDGEVAGERGWEVVGGRGGGDGEVFGRGWWMWWGLVMFAGIWMMVW